MVDLISLQAELNVINSQLPDLIARRDQFVLVNTGGLNNDIAALNEKIEPFQARQAILTEEIRLREAAMQIETSQNFDADANPFLKIFNTQEQELPETKISDIAPLAILLFAVSS